LSRACIVFASLVACGPTDSTIDVVHDACAPIALAVPSANDFQRLGITDAIELWRERGAAGLGITANHFATTPTIEIRFERAAAAFHGVYDDEIGVIVVNTALADRRELAIVVAHELGHAFGLLHVTDRASLMTPGNLTTPPTEDDQDQLRALWGACD
jgi:hypothetical protein